MTAARSQSDLPSIEPRLAWLIRLLGVGVLALVAVTWKLWTPQDVFPRVPLFRWAPPDWWDWTSLGLIVAGGLGLGVGSSRFVRSFAGTLAAGLAVAFVCDQHRLQPWAWQFFILALLLVLADQTLQWHGWQWLVISIYFYSALSKFDARFLHSIGVSFADTALGGMLQHHFSKRLPGSVHLYAIHYWVAWLFPLGELVLAILLAAPRTRKWGMWAAFGMHTLLLQILGPFGLNHSYGVLLWNVVFLFQAALLFMPREQLWSNKSLLFPVHSISASRLQWRNRCAWLLMSMVLLWPATYPFGLCDAWPGWALYVEPFPAGWLDNVNFARSHPAASQQILGSGPNSTVSIGSWSLRELNAPVYPHLRSTVAAALELSERFDTNEIGLRIYVRHRWETWAWNPDITLNDAHEIHAYAKRFWFNAYPTSMYRRAAKEKIVQHDG